MKAKTRAKPEPRLYSHKSVASMLDVPTATLRLWVREGEFPRPHSVVRTVWFYAAATIDHYIKTGEWPEGVRFKDDRVSRT